MQHLIDKLGGDISIHAPRTGSDQLFLQPPMHQRISIHAPRTGSDRKVAPVIDIVQNFNPRSPHGERQRRIFGMASRGGFQSTLPARGATKER